MYPSLVAIAKEKVQNSNVKVAAVSSYFPSGQVPMESKLLDTKYAIDSGADEIDIVINRKAFLEGDYRKVYDEIVALKEVCQDVHLKTIIEQQESGPMDLDLRDCNDLLPALSAFLAMGPGGRIRNASHAQFKESNRIKKTVEMLEKT